MYLRGSRWNMIQRRGRRSNPWRIAFWLALVAAAVYVNQVVVPATPPLFVPTSTPTRSPESFINEAMALFESGKLSQAVESYKKALFSDPDNASIYLAMARAQIYAGDYAEAQESAERALLLNNNNPLAHVMKAWALDFQGNFTQAEGAVKTALELDPNNALAHAVYAEILMDKSLAGQGDFSTVDRASAESKEALRLAPDVLESRRARGYVLWNTGNYAEAIQEYRAALAINNKISDLHMALGYNYRFTGEYDRALEAFEHALALDPTNPVPPLEISRTYATIGDFSRASQYAEQAVKADPSNPKWRGNYGVMLYKNANAQNKMEFMDQAITQLALAVRGGQTDDGTLVGGLPLNRGSVAEYYAIYGLALAKANRCAEAVPIFQAIRTNIPDDEINVYNAEQGLILCEESLKSGASGGSQATGDSAGNGASGSGAGAEDEIEPTASP
jgi:tetratricopeptide (TPR) repeat protein